MSTDLTQDVPISASLTEDLCELAAYGIPAMLDTETQLFCYRVHRTSTGMLREGISHRYTVMTLLGLHRYETEGRRTSPVPIQPVLEALFRDLDWVDNIGELGLLLWLCAAACPERLGDVCLRFDAKSALSKYEEVHQRHTMELSWFLAGLSHAKLAGFHNYPHMTPLAEQTFSLLIMNQGRHGTFGHSTSKEGLTARLRGCIGSFADQVYPIYACSKFAQAFKNEAGLDRASRCADAICRAQGLLGQWWWHYDSVSGKVLQRYPVYSVHQHGMAPMALLALSEATALDFSAPINKGLAWIHCSNELGLDMRDRLAGLVWRSVYRKNRLKMYSLEFVDYLFSSGNPPTVPPHDLNITFECRPYELGWLLYALAGQPRSASRA